MTNVDCCEQLDLLQAGIDHCYRCSLGRLQVNVDMGPLFGRWSSKPLEHPPMIIGMNPNVNRTPELNYVMGSKTCKIWTKRVLQELGVDGCWLTNLVKCSTLNNELTVLAATACRPWLTREVEALRPRIIIVSGAGVSRMLGVEPRTCRRLQWGDSTIPTIGLNHFAHTVRFGRLNQEMISLRGLLRNEGDTSTVE